MPKRRYKRDAKGRFAKTATSRKTPAKKTPAKKSASRRDPNALITPSSNGPAGKFVAKNIKAKLASPVVPHGKTRLLFHVTKPAAADAIVKKGFSKAKLKNNTVRDNRGHRDHVYFVNPTNVGIFDQKYWGSAIVGVKVSRKQVKSYQQPGTPEELMVPLENLKGRKIKRYR